MGETPGTVLRTRSNRFRRSSATDHAAISDFHARARPTTVNRPSSSNTVRQIVHMGTPPPAPPPSQILEPRRQGHAFPALPHPARSPLVHCRSPAPQCPTSTPLQTRSAAAMPRRSLRSNGSLVGRYGSGAQSRRGTRCEPGGEYSEGSIAL